MELSIQDLGAIGEFFGFLAVLVTLFYLARQTKQGVDLNRATEQRILIDQCNKYFRVTVEPEYLSAIRKGLVSYRSLTNDEQARAWVVFCQWLNHYEQCIYAHEAGLLPTPVLIAFQEFALGFIVSPGGREFWDDLGSNFGEDLQKAIAGHLQRGDLPAPIYENFQWLKLEDEQA
ncbi:MAG: hypothetical protein H6994_17590 [Pseudomonadales bacterium]|nr:hypothetical protein [Pseudomonadales bacterium]